MSEIVEVQNSSNIRQIEYNPTRQEMVVEFHVGARYLYSSVPLEEWVEFKTAESKGAYFAANIKGKYNGQKL